MIIYIFAALYGLIVGSFLNVCIYRIPAGLSIVSPRSRCGSCGTTLAPIDLIPVLSWMSTGGKCRYCHSKVSSRYALVEIITAVLTVAVIYTVGFIPELFWYLPFTWLAIVVSFVDWDTQEIPDRFSLMALIMGASFYGYHCVTQGFTFGPLIAAAVTFVALSVLMMLNAMGGGDVKFMTGTALMLGWPHTLLALYLGFIIGGLVAIVLVVLKRVGRKSMIAFGPYLMMGTLLTICYGERMVNYYFQMLF